MLPDFAELSLSFNLGGGYFFGLFLVFFPPISSVGKKFRCSQLRFSFVHYTAS